LTEWNHLVVFVGRRGFGKTTKALECAIDLSFTPAYILAHDPGGRIGQWTPKHGDVGHLIKRHQTAAELFHTLRTTPGNVNTLESVDAEELLQMAVDVGRASKQAKGVPVIAWINEVTSCSSGSVNRISGSLQRIAAQGRHDLVGLFVEAQSSRLINYQLLCNSTRLVCFRLTDQNAVDRLREFEVPENILTRIATLPRFECIEWDPDAIPEDEFDEIKVEDTKALTDETETETIQ